MRRKIVSIDEEKCNGCGACAAACHEGAIQMQAGKACLIKDDYCDGLGDCLPTCPVDAIRIIEREAQAYDEDAVKRRKAEKAAPACSCPETNMKTIVHEALSKEEPEQRQSRLSQWPVQIKLVPSNAPYFDGARLLVAADCTAYAYAEFHEEFIKNHITLVGCPKLDNIDYSEKLTEIMSNKIKSVTVVRMEVPCCGSIETAVKKALQNSGKIIPWQVVTISTDGKVRDDV